MKKIAYVGIDYHVNSITIAVIISESKDFYDTIRFKNDDKILMKYLKKLSKEYELKVCYEASCSGFTLFRKVRTWGFHCDVIAPSLIPKKPGDKRKNDFRDARNLADHYAKQQLTIIHVPTESEESIRSLVRCRLAIKESEQRVKQQINKFLLLKGFHWSRSKWTRSHRAWISQIKLTDEYSQMAFKEYLGHLEYIEARTLALDKQIEEIAQSDIYAASVKKLCAFRGIGTLSAMLLITEITDFRRFPTAGALMSYLGLIPGEESSGDKQQGKGITKSGNTRCRKIIIEGVQHSKRIPLIGMKMKEKLAQVDVQSANIAIKCMTRLNKRFWMLVSKGKSPNKAKTAIAREFAGFIWAMMRPENGVALNC